MAGETQTHPTNRQTRENKSGEISSNQAQITQMPHRGLIQVWWLRIVATQAWLGRVMTHGQDLLQWGLIEVIYLEERWSLALDLIYPWTTEEKTCLGTAHHHLCYHQPMKVWIDNTRLLLLHLSSQRLTLDLPHSLHTLADNPCHSKISIAWDHYKLPLNHQAKATAA